MKTITATFQLPGGHQATATASFETLPGTAPITWAGATDKLYTRTGTLPALGYPGSFTDWMKAIADRNGAGVEITATGDWEVFEE